MPTAKQNEWVSRTLGVAFPGQPAAGGATPQANGAAPGDSPNDPPQKAGNGADAAPPAAGGGPDPATELLQKQVKASLTRIAETMKGLPDGKEKEALTKQFTDLNRAAYGAHPDLADLNGKTLKLLETVERQSLTALCQDEEGKKKLDDMVAKLGGVGQKTSNPQDEVVCRAAIEARFGVTIQGTGLGQTKKLPKLYALMRSVPEADAAHNEKFRVLEYNAQDGQSQVSYYSADPKEIQLNLQEGDSERGGYDGDQVTDHSPVYYDVTTLHEIGHAVDAKENLMKGKIDGGDATWGDWKNETVESTAAAHGKGLLAAFSGGGKKAAAADLTALLKACLESGALPAKPAKANDALGSLQDDWDKIVQHAAVGACILVGREKAAAYTLDTGQIAAEGRIYFMNSNYGAWYSYSLASRQKTYVSKYQWSAPLEWFAETYAMYYMGKLKDSHPLVNAYFKGRPAPKK